MSLNEERSDQQNMEEEDNKIDVEEASINLARVKKEFDESDEFEFDENRYRLTLNFDNIFGDSSKELRENKDNLIGFLDDEVVMETGCIKLEFIKDEEDLIREIMEQSDCNKCGGIYEGYCPDCSSLSHILNNLTPNINPVTILNTVPINMLEVKEILTRQAVFALRTLPKGLILGPFEGVAPIESTTGLQWKIKDKKLVHDQNGNWMQYIESVPNNAAKNLDVFQFDGILYFETTRDIQEGEELLVCYCEEKDEVVNRNNEVESYFIPVKKEKYPRVYACTLCCLGFRLEKCLMEHKSKCQRDSGGSCEDFGVTQCRCCKVWLAKQEHLENHMLSCLENFNRLRHCFPKFQPTEEISTPIDGSAYTLTESEIIQSKWSHEINGKTHLKRRNKEDMLIIHSNMKEKMYKCSKCSFETNHRGNLNKHSLIHSDVKPFECDICKKKFNHEQNLKVHIKNLHSNKSEKEYKCSECSFKTKYKRSLKEHSVVHTGIKLFECEICNKKYTQKHSLKTHIENKHLNRNEKTHKCTECSFQTNLKRVFRVHIVVHSGIKLFECHICERKFTQKHYLQRHIRDQHSNSNEKQYKCSECLFQTNYELELNRHSITHSGIKLFECDICNKKYTRRHRLKMHIKNQH